jgi:hypothetical protein
MIVASLAPSHGGMVTQMNVSGSAPSQRYWNEVPTGMSIETPARRSVVCSPVASRRQIRPAPERMYQNSLTVACTVARLTCPGGTVEWIMPPVVPSIRNRISAPAGDRPSAAAGNARVCMADLLVLRGIIPGIDGAIPSP